MIDDAAESNVDALRVYLASRDAPCPSCGYNLRGLSSGSCPECNQSLRLDVNLAEPGLGRFLALLLPLAIVGGAFALGLVVVLTASIPSHRLPRGEEALALLVYPLVMAGVQLAFAVRVMRARTRNWLRSRSRAGALSLAAGVTAACLASVVFWTAWVVWFI